MRHVARIALVATAVLLSGLITACGERQVPRAAVTGTVTVDGKPLTGGQILVYRENTNANPGSGTINAKDGSFSIDSCPTGEVSVAIDNSMLDPNRGKGSMLTQKNNAMMAKQKEMMAKQAKSQGGASIPAQEKPEGSYISLPEKLRDFATSGIKLTIPPAGAKDLKIELKSK
jgi:hypothetical protein